MNGNQDYYDSYSQSYETYAADDASQQGGLDQALSNLYGEDYFYSCDNEYSCERSL